VPIWYRNGQVGFGDYTQLRLHAPYRLRTPVPIAVLVGEATASSAEVLAVALRAGPATRLFGAPTRGLSAGNRTFALEDGASLVLTVAATSDHAGRLLLGPVMPDEHIERRAGAERADDDAVTLRAATQWLAQGESCR
jgi:C-terminal processing protease CtpA/Prc